MDTEIYVKETEIIYKYSNSSFACSFFVVSWISSTRTFTDFVPNKTSMISPTLTLTDAFAGLPFTMTLPASHASLAIVRRLINLDTFKNLSNLILPLSSFPVFSSRKGLQMQPFSGRFIRSLNPLMLFLL